MARPCGCRPSGEVYVWTSANGKSTIEYTSLLVAKAKVHRVGGSYKTVSKG